MAAVTLWVLFSAWLGLPYVGARLALIRTAAALLWLELLALMFWSYGGTSTAHAAAFVDIPALSLAVLVAGAVYGLRIGRRATG